MNGPFERLHSIIGIEDAFIAFLEEPDAVHDYMEFITEFKIKQLEKMIDHYKIDIILFSMMTGAQGRMDFSQFLF